MKKKKKKKKTTTKKKKKKKKKKKLCANKEGVLKNRRNKIQLSMSNSFWFSYVFERGSKAISYLKALGTLSELSA